MRQLTIEFRTVNFYEHKSFFLCPSNELAYQWCKQWPWEKSSQFSALHGPRGSGKTHLLHWWCERVQGVYLGPHVAQQGDPLSLLRHHEQTECFALDDGYLVNDLWFLQFYNLIKEAQKFLIVGLPFPATFWPTAIADLRSRCATFCNLELLDPNEEYLGDFLIILFRHHGIEIDKDVAVYITNRIERSYETIHQWVIYLNHLSIEQGRSITLGFVRQVLKNTIR